jgi:hypothetical protein
VVQETVQGLLATQELTVALAGTGHTNPEIAARLFITQHRGLPPHEGVLEVRDLLEAAALREARGQPVAPNCSTRIA